MGLDNIPREYPCKKQMTAILDDEGRIDCDKTQEVGGCPWQNANPPKEGRVYGIMGTSCWYRGKYGNHLIEEAGIEGDEESGMSFYGNLDDGCYKTPDSCLALADAIGEALVDVNDQETKEGLAYAEWYLRWAAQNADGLNCWY